MIYVAGPAGHKNYRLREKMRKMFPNTVTTSTPAPSTKKYIKRQINKSIETKERNFEISEQQVSSNDTYPNSITFTDISSGRDDNQRVGNVVHLTKLTYKMFLHNSGNTDCLVRMLVVRSKGMLSNTQCNQGINLFKSGNATVSYVSATYATRIAKDVDRTNYTVLSDKIIKLAGLSKSEENNKIIKFTKYYKNKRTDFADQDSAEAINPIKLLFYVVDSALDTNVPVVEVTGETSTYYKDA